MGPLSAITDGLPHVRHSLQRGLAVFLVFNVLFLLAAQVGWINEDIFASALNMEFVLLGLVLILAGLRADQEPILCWMVITLGAGELLVSLAKLAGSEEGLLIFGGEILWVVNRLILVFLASRALLSERHEARLFKLLRLSCVAFLGGCVAFGLTALNHHDNWTRCLDFLTSSLDWTGRAAFLLISVALVLRRKTRHQILIAMAVILFTEQLNSLEDQPEFVLMELGFFVGYGLVLVGLMSGPKRSESTNSCVSI